MLIRPALRRRSFMAFPTSFAQNPEFYWEPEARRRGTDYFSVFVAVLAVLLMGFAGVAPRPFQP
jgi:hypothetical protein